MKRLITRDEVATMLGKPASWLRYAERHRLIPFVKIGEQIRYEENAIEEWVEERRISERSRLAPPKGQAK